jgi:signal transduction histidine kinase
MSLRNRILILFGIFSILPLLALAAFSYWQTRTLLDDAVEEQLTRLATTVAQDLEQTLAGVELDLEALGQALPEEGRLPFLRGGTLGTAAYVGLKSPDGELLTLAGSVPGDSVRCENGWSTRLLKFFHDGPETVEGEVLEVGIWASDIATLAGLKKDTSVRVMDTSGEWVLFSQDCLAALPASEPLHGESLWKISAFSDGQGTVRFSENGDNVVGAVARLEGPDLVVLATSSETEVLGPLRRLLFSYFLVVLVLAGSTGIAFSIMIRRYTRSLSELARAAEEIGLGELDPWLPLPGPGETGQLTVAFSRMLARIRKMMDQVSQSGRLAVVGQLSAYLAHEIRNPLSSIKLNLQRLLRWTHSGRLPAYCREPLEISLKEVERLNTSVTGVLQLSRANDAPREVLGLHELVEEAADLVSSRFRRQDVGLLLDLDAEADLVLARPGQLKSAVLNLMVNALEAQERGGRLAVRTSLGRMPDHEGPCVFLRFRDQGSGIPSEIKDRIFEPFFTTKPGGAGIGLAMAKQAIGENGGDLFLAASFSDEKGAEFVAAFPLAATQAVEGESDDPDGLSPGRQYPTSEFGLSSTPRPGRKDIANVSYLLTPDGLAAVLPSVRPEPEEEA